ASYSRAEAELGWPEECLPCRAALLVEAAALDLPEGLRERWEDLYQAGAVERDWPEAGAGGVGGPFRAGGAGPGGAGGTPAFPVGPCPGPAWLAWRDRTEVQVPRQPARTQ